MLNEASTRYLAFESQQKTEEGATELFNYVVDSYEGPQTIHSYAIAERSNDQYLGSCGFAPCGDTVVECYYCINAEFQGLGFATEATGALVEALSHHVEVRAYCHPDNLAAHGVARKIGMDSRGKSQHEHSGLVGELFVKAKK